MTAVNLSIFSIHPFEYKWDIASLFHIKIILLKEGTVGRIVIFNIWVIYTIILKKKKIGINHNRIAGDGKGDYHGCGGNDYKHIDFDNQHYYIVAHSCEVGSWRFDC
jgi:hypothetical protein